MKSLSFVAVTLLLLSAHALAATRIEAPTNISTEAQAFLSSRPVGNMTSALNTSDPEMIGRMRASLGSLFLKNSQKIDPAVTLSLQSMETVDGYWVNGAAPDTSAPVIIYLHGGGYILGSAQTNIGSAIRIRRDSGLAILSVEYRLAPEHPFPADLEDAVAAYSWLLVQGYAPEKIGVYGDSAGGGLSLALVLKLQELGLPLPGAVAVLSPLVDLSNEGDTRITLKDVDPILRTPIGGGYDMYMAGADATNPLVSPVHGNYENFPPLLIQVGTRERLLSDAVRLARVARNDGANVTLDVWEGMWHGWHDSPGVPEADQACQVIATFFEQHLQN